MACRFARGAASSVTIRTAPFRASHTRMVAMNAEKVFVTGATGKTGKLIARKVKESEDFELVALTRSEKGRETLKKELQVDDSEVVVKDVVKDEITEAMQGCSALIVATSAKPELVYSSMPGFFWKKFVRGEKVMPGFTFAQMPEQVDWIGQKMQFDAAKAAGVKHIVLVSSMGGTDLSNTLNLIGDGNILVWKRKAEQYLVSLGVTYTIIHPGGLKDLPGSQSGIVLDVDDKLLKRKERSIARADVAELCVQSLRIDAAKNRSIDAINDTAVPTPQGTAEIGALFSKMKGNCDYSINPSP